MSIVNINKNFVLEDYSQDFVKIIVEIETEFDIEFEDEKLQFFEFPTVQTLIDYVKKRLVNK